MSTLVAEIKLYTAIVPAQGGKAEYIVYFTNANEPVSWRGQQYIPLSTFDAAKWAVA